MIEFVLNFILQKYSKKLLVFQDPSPLQTFVNLSV
jgi:hypothetical protein